MVEVWTLEFSWNGEKCNENFLHTDVLRPLASVSSIGDGGSIVVIGILGFVCREQEQRMPTSSRNDVFVMQLKALPSTRATRTVRFDEPKMNSVFRRLT